MKNYTFRKNVTCADPVLCSDKMVNNLENSLSIILKPKVMKGIHHGWLDIVHTPGDHLIDVHIFTESPSGRKNKKPSIIPTLNSVRSNIL